MSARTGSYRAVHRTVKRAGQAYNASIILLYSSFADNIQTYKGGLAGYVFARAPSGRKRAFC